MKLTEKYIVFRNKETGAYLVDYKNEGTLAYKANYIREIKHAKTMEFEAFEEQRQKVELLAKTMDCEILVVEATYDLKQLNGEDAKEIEMSSEEQAKAALRSLLDMLGE
jgi:hypothetical protein